MNWIRNNDKLAKIIFILACAFLAFYGLYYNSLSTVWLMVVTIPFILYQSIYVGHLRFDINFCFLMETFFVKAMLDQHIGKQDIVPTTMAIPMLMYLFGKLLVAKRDYNFIGKKKRQKDYSRVKVLAVTSALTIGITVLGLLNFILTRKSPIAVLGYYNVAFTGNTFYTDKLAFCFNYIFAGCFAVAGLIWFVYRISEKNETVVKARPYVMLGVSAAVAIGFAVKYIRTERFAALKEGIHLIITKHWGNFGLDLTHNNSTSNMWLDYGRDYGILVFVTLFIFFILTIKDAVKLAANKKVDIFLKSLLLFMFIGTNVYYFVDSFAYQFPYYWYLGLVICGLISEVADWEQ
ncbi:hypothetical protein SAMN02745725_02660 [Pseudobutyrivibrio xylanivorans DSM 14809]|uniref:Oligosaccharide repeat unit polymerase n=1 Tax=Pseudobutyrivibrio xylanivorans DSM 14809 TaxID=1123012 RepID=A0A1M6JQ57_PSEXY|nr:hypothetical protein SAMN02745725_02660 [Pseudobutyrivibrio xylanivorans DSM 14809]